MRAITDIERFLSKTEAGDNGCLNWTAARKPNGGYGTFTIGKKNVRAHRWHYEYVFGKIPAGKVIDHLCRNTKCVRLSHLEVVTERENTLRGIGPAAQNAAKTHCKNGHEFTPQNTRFNMGKYGPWRVCRACKKRIEAARRRRRRAERKNGTNHTQPIAYQTRSLREGR